MRGPLLGPNSKDCSILGSTLRFPCLWKVAQMCVHDCICMHIPAYIYIHIERERFMQEPAQICCPKSH